MSVLEKLAYVQDVRQYLPSMVEENKVNVGKAHQILDQAERKLNNPEQSKHMMIMTPQKFPKSESFQQSLQNSQSTKNFNQVYSSSYYNETPSSLIYKTPKLQTSPTISIPKSTTEIK